MIEETALPSPIYLLFAKGYGGTWFVNGEPILDAEVLLIKPLEIPEGYSMLEISGLTMKTQRPGVE